MKTKERSDYNLKSWPWVFHKVYRWELDSFLVSQTLGPRPQYARYSDLRFFVFGHEVFAWSDPYSWHNKISNIRWSVPCCFHSIVFGNFWCVLCFVDNRLSGCWQAFPRCFHTIFTTWFANLGVLGTITFLPGQDLHSVLCIIFFMVIQYFSPFSLVCFLLCLSMFY